MSVYSRCQYRGCGNSKSDQHRLFRFPKRSDPRCDIWIENSGNNTLRKWSNHSIRKAGLCKEHFSNKAFWTPDKLKLRPKQVPISCTLEINNPITADVISMDSQEEPESNESITNVSETSNNDENKILRSPENVIIYLPATKACDVNMIEEDNQFQLCENVPLQKENTENEKKLVPEQNQVNSRFIIVEELNKLRKENAKLRREHDRMLKKIMRIKQETRKMKSLHRAKIALLKKKKLSINEFLDAHHCTNPTARAMVTLQLRNKKLPCESVELNESDFDELEESSEK